MKTRNAVFMIALFAILTFVTTMALSGASTPPNISIYDEDSNFNEAFDGTAVKYMATMQFDSVFNEGFFPRNGEVFQRATPTLVRVSGVCRVKKAVHWTGKVTTDLAPTVVLFDVNDNTAVFDRVFFASVLDIDIRQFSDSGNAVGCQVAIQEIE